MKVTAEMLRDKNACKGQVLIFEKEWPNGTRITKSACLRAVELKLDINWFAYWFLKDKSLEAYQKAREPAWTKYEKACEPAWTKYYNICGPYGTNCYKTCVSHRVACNKACTPHYKKYSKAIAIALWEASKI